MLRVSTCPRAAAALFLVLALGFGSAQAQDREDPRSSRGHSLARSFIIWLMDTLSAPPG